MARLTGLQYRLTEKVSIYGCGCKLEKLELEKLLHATGLDRSHDSRVLAGVGDDAGVIRCSGGIAVVQHLDFFTPIVDDPYIQGKIAACNAASDIFAKGVTELIGALTIIGLPEDMPEDILQALVKGFSAICSSIRAPIVGGQTIYCAWPIIGGAITGITRTDEVVYNSTARPGDELVLTKPLGNRSIMAALREANKRGDGGAKRDVESRETVSRAIDLAIRYMTSPNNNAARAMMKVGVNACTDVTGFGILGHASTMAKRSKAKIVIETLPVIKGALELAKEYGHPLDKGTSAETSGGLLISVPRGKLDLLLSRLARERVTAYRVGRVEKGTGEVVLSEHPKIIEV